MTQAFTVFLEELWILWEAKISGQEANVEQKQDTHNINTFLSNMNLKLFIKFYLTLLNVSLHTCVCVCVCVCVHVYVVYEDTNLYNDIGMT